jgi:hypothetical protein
MWSAGGPQTFIRFLIDVPSTVGVPLPPDSLNRCACARDWVARFPVVGRVGVNRFDLLLAKEPKQMSPLP